MDWKCRHQTGLRNTGTKILLVMNWRYRFPDAYTCVKIAFAILDHVLEFDSMHWLLYNSVIFAFGEIILAKLKSSPILCREQENKAQIQKHQSFFDTCAHVSVQRFENQNNFSLIFKHSLSFFSKYFVTWFLFISAFCRSLISCCLIRQPFSVLSDFHKLVNSHDHKGNFVGMENSCRMSAKKESLQCWLCNNSNSLEDYGLLETIMLTDQKSYKNTQNTTKCLLLA